MSPSTVLIVRDEAASTLRQAFDAGREGTPQIVIVRGEAGIGKTRLLQEFHRELTILDAEAVFATGQCVDMGEIGSPYTPIRRLLRDLHSRLGDELLSAATPSARLALRGLLPEIAAPAASGATASDADTVSDALGALLDTVSHDRHLVLLIEDLHWSDTATLALLKTLSFTLRGEHLTLVMTYRTDDVGRGHPLRGVLADLERNRAVTFIDLERLAQDDAAALTRMLAPELDATAVQRIVERSDGLPFFIEELVALHEDRLPETLRDLLLARVESLSTGARDAVDLLAVGGVHIDSDLLDEAAQGWIERDRLHGGLREALAANILVTDSTGYGFRHALLQEAVHDDVLPSIRSGLHARFAGVLDVRLVEGHRELAAEVAEHWAQARDSVRAFDALIVARGFATDTAPEMVASQIGERMLEMWAQIPDAADRVGMSRSRFCARTAEDGLDDPRRALRIARSGLLETPPEHRTDRAALLNIASYALSILGDAAASRDSIIEALELLDRDDPSQHELLAECLLSRVRGAALSLRRDDFPELQRLTDEAISLTLRMDDPILQSRVVDAAAVLLCLAGSLHGALDRLRAHLVHAPTNRTELVLFISEQDVLVRLGRYAEADETTVQNVRGLPRDIDGLHFVELNHAEALFCLGRAEDGRRTAERGLDGIVGLQIMVSYGWRLLGLADIWSDRAELARQRFEQLRTEIDALTAEDGEELAGWGTCTLERLLNLAEIARDAGERTRTAEKAFEGALDIVRAKLEPGISRPHVVGAARALADAMHAGMDAEALEPVRAMIADVLDRHGADEASPAIAALVAAETARGTAGTPSETVDAWRAASDLAADGFVPVRQLWYARYRLAEALLDAGERDEASALLEMIGDGAPAHGIDVVARWARELAARAGLADADTGGLPQLTARERQVLELVAEGLTNPEIGQRLFISPKTASVHVSAILTKVGAANRTEAAAIFHRQG
ncbi:helix-turn-helix transcriptional regulator [Microbacterium sp. H1-D42]|uniref:helix-turn-helix transcriptional regulator n=1 Tax=Microbacterium sp. H1-D42 TaxID=2925844 RepID=UPI001F53174D|nr:helix-turn-helix transcriptional regulator [Microbacterium sp. H1-D42]UNK71130.1 AAA family ATPase [Microbacterium sp. H1-D42]